MIVSALIQISSSEDSQKQPRRIRHHLSGIRCLQTKFSGSPVISILVEVLKTLMCDATQLFLATSLASSADFFVSRTNHHQN
jgi:hypothetical protein